MRFFYYKMIRSNMMIWVIFAAKQAMVDYEIILIQINQFNWQWIYEFIILMTFRLPENQNALCDDRVLLINFNEFRAG